MSNALSQDTLVIIKPDALARRFLGRIVSRIEDKEIDIIALKLLSLNQTQAENLYAPHHGKYFYPRLLRFITSGPLVIMICRGLNAIARIRQLVGENDPDEATPGTIRGDFCVHQTYNMIHASDSPQSAEREISIFFTGQELTTPLPNNFPWYSYPELTESL